MKKILSFSQLPDLSEIEEPIVFLNSNGKGDNFLAIGQKDELIISVGESNILERIDAFVTGSTDWIFGYFSYDLKNVFENLTQHAPEIVSTPLVHLIKVKSVMRWNATMSSFYGDGTSEFWNNLFRESSKRKFSSKSIKLHPRIDKERYLKAVVSLQDHIRYGNIYEVNYCQEFGVSCLLEDSYQRYLNLNNLTEAPFSAYMRLGDIDLMCASPERFLSRMGDKLISQPIKGTIKRSDDPKIDESLRSALQTSEKDRSENVMIVDLVRNDLSRIAQRGTVQVEELFGVHTFKTVHHLISTVSAQINEASRFSEILRATFPMGSMTGAPKISAMNLIDNHEASARGLYSGSIGYIAPNGDFDFNVVIRSLIYHRQQKYLSCSAGGAITALSDPEKEFEESLLKAEAIQLSLALN
jgi:para-aminobenzoate synthetase component 1